MNNSDIQVFDFNGAGIRTLADENGEMWLCAKDVCNVLGYKNDSKAIGDHCRANGVTKRYLIDNIGRKQETAFINEGNLYRLIVKSRKPEAEAFERLVMEEILPAIRKTGRYAMGDVVPGRTSLDAQGWIYEGDVDGVAKAALPPVGNGVGYIVAVCTSGNGAILKSTRSPGEFVAWANATIEAAGGQTTVVLVSKPNVGHHLLARHIVGDLRRKGVALLWNGLLKGVDEITVKRSALPYFIEKGIAIEGAVIPPEPLALAVKDNLARAHSAERLPDPETKLARLMIDANDRAWRFACLEYARLLRLSANDNASWQIAFSWKNRLHGELLASVRDLNASSVEEIENCIASWEPAAQV